MIFSDEFFESIGQKRSDFSGWEPPPPVLGTEPRVIVRVLDHRDFEYDIDRREWHEWMQSEDFECLRQILNGTPALQSMVGEMIDGNTKSRIAAILADRMRWLTSCRFVHEMNGKWMFNRRRYCEDAGLSYEEPKYDE